MGIGIEALRSRLAAGVISPISPSWAQSVPGYDSLCAFAVAAVASASAPALSDRASPMAEKTFAEILEDATNRSRDMDAPLSERLKAVADEVGRLSPQFAAIVDRMVARLEANSVGQSAPHPG